MADPDPPAVPLRAHMALCLLGFRGEGYSPAFVREMEGLAGRLAREADTRLQLVDRPDRLCAACPHLGAAGCTLGGPEHEAHMRAQDRDVLARLGLEAGAALTWGDLRERIARRIGAGDLPAICTTCPWLSLGWCAAGLRALAKERAAS